MASLARRALGTLEGGGSAMEGEVERMDASYRPIAGQVVMVELGGHDVDDGCLSGVIMPNADGEIAIDLGRGSPELADGDEVVVSVFSNEAMYKLHGAVHP